MINTVDKMCECVLCKRNRSYELRASTMSEDAHQLMNELLDMAMDAEMDRDYYRSLVYGTWTDADSVIQQAREKQKAKSEGSK